jgi:hypothetical protein
MPSGEVMMGRLKRNAHWVALIGGLIPAVTASVISVITAYKGEPQATKAYELLAPQVNNQMSSLQIILTRLAKIEGHYEGLEMGKLSARIDSLLVENADLKRKLETLPVVKKSVEPTPAPASAPAACKEGHIAGTDGKCYRVQKTVAKKVKAAEAKVKDYERKLREKQEWLRREKERSQKLNQKLEQMLQKKAAPVAPVLQAVPPDLKGET